MGKPRNFIVSLAFLLVVAPVWLFIRSALNFNHLSPFKLILAVIVASLSFIYILAVFGFLRKYDQSSTGNRTIIGLGAIGLLFVIYLFSYPLLPPVIRYWSEVATCNGVIARVEAYHAKYGRYPEATDRKTLSDNPGMFSDESRYYYSNFTNNGITVHEVGFNLGFDNSCHYDLDEKKWEFNSCDF